MDIILVDGTCIFCNGLVRWIVRHDRHAHFRYAHLQSELARAALERHGVDPEDRDGIYLVVASGTPMERLLVDGRAARAIWPRITPFGMLAYLVPIFVLDFMYKLFARTRYSLFGKADACLLPTAAERARFIE